MHAQCVLSTLIMSSFGLLKCCCFEGRVCCCVLLFTPFSPFSDQSCYSQLQEFPRHLRLMLLRKPARRAVCYLSYRPEEAYRSRSVCIVLFSFIPPMHADLKLHFLIDNADYKIYLDYPNNLYLPSLLRFSLH